MCYPFASVTFLGMAAFWSLLSTLTILNLWNPILKPSFAVSDSVRAMAIMLFSTLQFGSIFLNVFCLISSSSTPSISRFRSFKHIWIALIDAAFDMMVGGAILNDVDGIARDSPGDLISASWLIHIGTVTGLSMEILEFLVEVLMLGVEEGHSHKGAYCTFCASNIQIFGANFECAIMLYLLSNVSIEDDVVFVGIAISVLVILELFLLALCALTVWHQLGGCLIVDPNEEIEAVYGRASSLNTSVPFGGNRLGIRI